MDIDHVKEIRSCDVPPDNDSKVWSETDRQLLVEYYSRYMGITEIAWTLGRSELAVVQRLQKEGMFPKKRSGQGEKTPCLCGKCGKKRRGLCSQQNWEKEVAHV